MPFPEDLEDDVPVYFSPGDDNVEIAENIDKKALLEDEPPIEWSRYKPEKTLEDASKEAKMMGEVKIRGKSNKDKDNRITSFGLKSIGQSGAAKGDKPREDSTDDSSDLPSPKPSEQKLLDMRNKLGIGNRVEVKLSHFEAPGDSSSPVESASSQTSQTRAEEPALLNTLSPRWRKILLGLTALNIFALGIWCGSFLFPNSRATTSFAGDQPSPGKNGEKSFVTGDTTFSKIVERLNPVVVNVDTRFRAADGAGRGYGNSGQAQASGLIISSEGHILTNNHVIPENTQIRITLSDGRDFDAKVVGRDSYTDLAVVKIKGGNLPVAPFGNIHKMHPGDWSLVIGSPYGLDHSVSLGVISALDRKVADFNHHVPFIQTDAAINPGNSGGPLVNIDGEVIGIATGAVKTGARGIAFAIPIDVANRVAKKLIRDGKIARPYLGLYMRDYDPDAKKSRTLPGHPIAVTVANVVPGGPADISGLRRGDIILKVNGTVVNSSDEVRAFIKTSNPGDILVMSLQRGLNVIEKKVKLGLYPSNM